VQQLWQEVLGEDFIKVPRLSRIYYRGRFSIIPSIYSILCLTWAALKASNFIELLQGKVVAPSTRGKLGAVGEQSLRRTSLQTFFQTYTEVWGFPTRSKQNGQPIKGLSLKKQYSMLSSVAITPNID